MYTHIPIHIITRAAPRPKAPARRGLRDFCLCAKERTNTIIR